MVYVGGENDQCVIVYVGGENDQCVMVYVGGGNDQCVILIVYVQFYYWAVIRRRTLIHSEIL